MALTSDYRFRGLSQTGKKPAIQGGLDYSHESGVYLGTWLSSVSGNQYPSGSGLEMDFYGGYKFEVAKDVGLDLGLIHVYYPGVSMTAATPFSVSVPGTTAKADTTEIYAGLTYQWFSIKYNRTIGSSLFGIDYPTAGQACPIRLGHRMLQLDQEHPGLRLSGSRRKLRDRRQADPEPARRPPDGRKL